jgi:tRNA uridine 5-carbamoylmethylation protein Kti12
MAIYVVVGIPASGKTTWIQEHKEIGDRVISFDDQFAKDEDGRRYWWKDYQKHFWDTTPMDSKTMCSGVQKMLFDVSMAIPDSTKNPLRVNNIFIEGPFLSIMSRGLLLNFLHAVQARDTTKHFHPMSCVAMRADPVTSFARNVYRKNNRVPDFVIRDQNQAFEPPILSEGWDQIKTIVNDTCSE